MNVLLIRPPVSAYTIGLKHIMICEPLELEYVAAGLVDHNVQIFDGILERGLKQKINSFKPQIVGLGCYINGVNEVIKICRRVKRWNPACLTVVGGVQASRVPGDFDDPAVDCIALGDGTTLMPEIVAAYQNGNSLDTVPGLALPLGDRRVKLTPERSYMPHPDSIPFPRRDLVNHLRHRYYYLFHQPVALLKTTWGCWYKCNFCYTWQITNGIAYSRSPESIAEELAQLDTEEIYIVDDIFLTNRSRLAKLARLLRERNIRKKYLVFGRADFIAQNEDVITEWAELGLRAVLIGLEAATDSELNAMDKRSSVDYNRRAIAVLRNCGVDVYGSLIPQPDYTPRDWERLSSFIEENHLYYLNISPLTPLPGTRIWDQYKNLITVDPDAHGLWDFSHVVLPTRMPLKRYYRALLKVYSKAILDIRRANRLSLQTQPPVWTLKYLRLWLGAFKIMFQFLAAHRHHLPHHLKQAMDKGPEYRPAADVQTGQTKEHETYKAGRAHEIISGSDHFQKDSKSGTSKASSR